MLTINMSEQTKIMFEPTADKKALRAYTNGEALYQFAQPSVGSRSSLLALYIKQCSYTVLANSEGPDQTARKRSLVRIFAVRIGSKVPFLSRRPICLFIPVGAKKNSAVMMQKYICKQYRSRWSGTTLFANMFLIYDWNHYLQQRMFPVSKIEKSTLETQDGNDDCKMRTKSVTKEPRRHTQGSDWFAQAVVGLRR